MATPKQQSCSHDARASSSQRKRGVEYFVDRIASFIFRASLKKQTKKKVDTASTVVHWQAKLRWG